MSNLMLDRTAANLWQLLLFLVLSPVAERAWAIAANQIDDFNDAMSHGWSVNNGLTSVFVAEHEGPEGEDDHALLMDTSFMMVQRLLVTNTQQWTGDWASEGITQVSLDIRNPNAYVLSMRLGIAGPGGFGPGGSGDTHVTDAITIPADNAWHSVTFDVLSSDFTAISGYSTATALTDVTHFRILHNATVSFIGEAIDGDFFLDNIRAVAAALPLEGDHNGDSAVDASDYVAWRKEPSEFGGDPDGYNTWRTNFGDTAMGAGASQTSHPVPEPTAAFLPIIVLLAARHARWRVIA